MRNCHKIYYGYSQEELSDIWKDCVFVFDNNILLDLYRVTNETTTLLINAIRYLKDRIYVPHQVIHEFYTNRVGEIEKANKRYDETLEAINFLSNSITNNLRLNIKDKILENSIKMLTGTIETIKKRDLSVTDMRNDHIMNELMLIFESQGGDEYCQDDLMKIYNEARERYSKKIPPGYKDVDKPEPRKFGDYVLWRQILDYATLKKVSIFFITNDSKEDWIYVVNGKKQGPRYELRKEFIEKTEMNFHIYNLSQFLEFYTKGNVSPEIINDINSSSSETIKSPSLIKSSYGRPDSNKYKETVSKYVSIFLEIYHMLIEMNLKELSYDSKNIIRTISNLEVLDDLPFDQVRFLISQIQIILPLLGKELEAQELNYDTTELSSPERKELEYLYSFITTLKSHAVEIFNKQ